MKVILVGHPGSEKIRKPMEYLTSKYLPGFDVIFLSYEGAIDGWAGFVADYLETLEDQYLIFALDDYLLTKPIDDSVIPHILAIMEYGYSFAKLCEATPQDNDSYPVTTQYTLWDRKYLINLLRQVTHPWQFEVEGSNIFKASKGKALFVPILSYYTNSSLSRKWQGVRLDGLNEEDIKMVQQFI